jgi:sulfur carrier protein ThiS
VLAEALNQLAGRSNSIVAEFNTMVVPRSVDSNTVELGDKTITRPRTRKLQRELR